MIDDKLKKWVEDNKMIVSDSSVDESDIIIIEGVGKFLYLHPFEGNVIDEDFAFVMSDEEFNICDEKQVDFILFEFGGKFYYSTLKEGRI